MRKTLVFFGLLAAAIAPASAARRVTVAQLEEALQAAQSTHRPDDVVVHQVADMALTERLSLGTLQRLTAMSPGAKTTEAMRVLADASAFLTLPASEVPTRPTPDFATQKVIMGLAVTYVVHTVPTLPNFMATRTTVHFADLPDPGQRGSGASAGGLFRLGSTRATIAYRDGRESDDPVALASAEKRSGRKSYVTTGLTSWGEFGPILSVALLDAAKGKLGWARWESWNGKPAAVFQFSVARAASHYSLQYQKRTVVDAGNGVYSPNYSPRGRSEGSSSGPVKDMKDETTREVTGYHGTLAVDPEAGTILRIEIEADLAPDNDIRQAAIVVEYGPVQIGDGTYYCPIHSLAFSTSIDSRQLTPISPIETVKEQQLNDVTFGNYRRFGSESTLVMNPQEGGAGDEPGAEVAASEPASAGPSTAAAAQPENAASAGPAVTSAATPAPKAAPAEEQEMSVRVADSLPDLGGDAARPNGGNAGAQGSSFTLQTTTRLVDVGLIATDKRGKPIRDLRADEIEIYDNGRKQQVATFSHAEQVAAAQAAVATQATPQQPIDTFTNAAPVSAMVEQMPDLLILMMDESHLPFNDLNRARGEVLRYLKAARPDARLAIYSIGEHGFRVIQDVTTDHEAAQARLAKWTPSAAGIAQAARLEERNRQQFDTVRNPEDLNSVNGNNIEVPDYINSTDPQLRQLGDNPLGMVLISMIALARHFGPVQGHKTLVWISGDSALYDWQDKSPSMERTVSNLEAAVGHARDALNEAHISLYAVDASMMSFSGAAVDASLANAQVQLNPVATANSAPGGSGSGRQSPGGRMTAQMQADTHDIQPQVRQLAESTGGRAVNKGSDLEKTLDGITQESEALYEIAFSPDAAADNKFHTLQLKVTDRKDVRLRYRSGYMYAEEATSAKERFQDAVWSPQDLRGISLTAEPVTAADAATGQSLIKLRIGFAGLALKQEPQGASTGRWTDNLYVFVAQRDDGVRKAEVSGDTLRLALKQGTYDTGMPTGIPYQREVAVKSKLGSVRVIVVDGNSGRMGSVTLPSSALRP